MIETHEIPDGLLLSLEPFKEGKKNESCKIIAEIRWSKSKGSVVRFRICELQDMMMLSDMTILMNAMRLLIDEVNKRRAEGQKQTARRKRG